MILRENKRVAWEEFGGGKEGGNYVIIISFLKKFLLKAYI